MNVGLSREKKIAATLIMVMLAATTLTTMFLPKAVSSMTPSYFLEATVPPSPWQLQEGEPVIIWVHVTAGDANTTYLVNLNITDPANATTTASVSLTTDAAGYGNVSVVYPTNFTVNAHTSYTGFYQISASFNETLGTATGNFFIGLTNATRYNRFQVVDIRATNYTQPNEQAWVNITMGGEITFSQNVPAKDGVIETSWTIPGNATIGTHNVTVTSTTPQGTVKAIRDTQTFEVRDVFWAWFQTQDFNGDALVGAVVKVANSTSSLSANTNETGWAEFLLDADIYRVEAYWKNVVVNITTDFVVAQNVTQVLKCRVANMAIMVEDEDQQPLPFVNITLASNYTTLFSERISFETDFNGMVNLRNLLMDANYTIEARRYGFVFYTTSFKKLPEQPLVNITIIAPTYIALIRVLDSKNAPAKDLTVKAYEWSSGTTLPAYPPQETDAYGNVTLHLTFGKYRIRVYKDKVLLNETIIDLIRNQSPFDIYCGVYKADLKVVVIDYFGQPIPNALVIVERKVDSQYVETMTDTTKLDGAASFNGFIGGDSRIAVFVAGRMAGLQSVYLAYSKVVTFRMSGYVAVAGYILETSHFVIVVVLIVIIVAFFLALTYKRMQRVLIKKKA